MNPQLVSPTGSSVAGHYLLAAITAHLPYDTPGWNAVMQALKDYRATAPSGIERGKVPVSLIVAGHEIPFIETVEDMYRRITADFEGKVLEKAKELLSESRLTPLHEALEAAQWQIEQALLKAVGKGES